jgi:hypothetical protein
MGRLGVFKEELQLGILLGDYFLVFYNNVNLS